MAATEINTLIEQCDQRAQVLIDEAEAAFAEVDEILESANTIAENLVKEGEEARAAWEAILAELESAEEELETELNNTSSALDEFKTKIGEIEESVTQVMNDFQARLEELNSRKAEIDADMNEKTDTAKSSYEQYIQNLQDTEEKMDSHRESAKNQNEAFETAVDDASASFQEKKAALFEGFAALTEELNNQLETVAGGFEQFGQEARDQGQTLQDSLSSLAENVIGNITAKFAEEILNELTGGSEGLTDALSVLDSAGGEAGDLLENTLGEVTDKVSFVTDLIDKIEPVLELAQSILG